MIRDDRLAGYRADGSSCGDKGVAALSTRCCTPEWSHALVHGHHTQTCCPHQSQTSQHRSQASNTPGQSGSRQESEAA